MRPESKRNRQDQFTPKYRNFHPQSTLFMRNPFDHDITFYVADEQNVQWKYRIEAGKINELPGGAVATLGLKEVVDKMISDEGVDVLRIWDPTVRKRKEDIVIVRVREAPQLAGGTEPGGEVSLGTTEDELAERDNTPMIAAEEPEFPGAKRPGEQTAAAPPPAAPARPATKPNRPIRTGNGNAPDPALAGIAASSAGSKDQVIESD